VGIGAIDPLSDLLEISRKHGLWFHVDGAYGAPAVVVPELYPELSTLREADSLAVDPHKWLYAPLEAGCALVRDRELHRSTFSYHPDYYHFEEESLNYFDLGPQNSRAFRALKIWLSLKQAGRNGYRTMIRTDIELAKRLAGSLSVTPEFRDIRQGLSIVTFRYVPLALQTEPVDHTTDYLNLLNQAILERLEKEGEFFLSKAVVSGRFLLRVCIVNFRTESSDVDALPEYLLRLGERLDREMRGDTMKSAQPGG
jgi:glutamate/tyrosine decarboxylase-like PLP-dependent enzyme